MTNHR